MISRLSFTLCFCILALAGAAKADFEVSVANLGTYIQGDAALSNFTVDVLLSRSGVHANSKIVASTIAFAVANGDGTSGAIVFDPPATYTGSWTSTLWSQAPSVAFNATQATGDDVDQSTTNVLNGFFPTFSAVDGQGTLARFVVDFSGLAPGTYSINPNLNDESSVTLDSFATVNATGVLGSITINPVPEPSCLLAAPFIGMGLVYRRRRRPVA